MSRPATTSNSRPGPGTLGTFAGVFTPSILTILGIILFLRLGYVVGNAGLGRALVIILLANTISVLTSISLSAVATNLKVKAGGDYYLISRTLGVGFGGAIGIVLFLAQSISIAFYAIGFGEAVAATVGATSAAAPRLLATAAVAALFVLAWLGADWATRFQYVIMALLFAAIAAFFAGGLVELEPSRLAENWSPGGDLPFWAVFALFFPAVTGFTQGVSMSGDLRDPGKSLPRGTFAAVGISVVVYLAVAVLFAACLPSSELIADYGAMRKVSLAPWLIDGGVIAATLSSALASFLGAPRILQSLAADRIFPALDLFAKGAGPAGNPRRGVLLAAAIALAGIALGNLNLLAPVVTMFFLISYGLINHATYYEARSRSPSFRPRFRWFHPSASLVGGLGCLAAMLAIHPAAGAVAISFLFAIYQYVKRTARPERWADSSRSSYFQGIRERLRAMSSELEHPRDWRPVVLAFSDSPERRERLIRFTTWIDGGSGITTAVRIVEGNGARARKKRAEAEKSLSADLTARKLDAYARVIATPDVPAAFEVLLQAYGVGPIRANSIVLNWFDQERLARDSEGLRTYGHYLRTALRLECNVIVLSADPEDLARLEANAPDRRRIDVWWLDDRSSHLALLLAYLVTRSEMWEDATIRVLAAAPEGRTLEEAREDLEALLEDVRVRAEATVLPALGKDVIASESASSDLVFVPFRLERGEPRGPRGGALDELVEALAMTAFVLAAQDVDLDAEPEEGRHADVADAVDEADRRDKASRAADDDAREIQHVAEKTREAVREAVARGAPDDKLEELESRARDAEKKAETATRRAARAEAKAAAARKQVESVTGQPAGDAAGETPSGDAEAGGAPESKGASSPGEDAGGRRQG